MKRKNIFKLFVKLYGWKLLPVVLALAMLLLVRGYIINADPQLPPGSAPTPDIDPL